MSLVGTVSLTIAPQLLMAATSATPLNPYQHPDTTEPIRLWGFPGQGIQQVGMGRDLYESSSAFRGIVDRGHTALGGKGVDLRDLMFEGPQEELTRTLHAQPAILTASIALLDYLREEEGLVISPKDLMAGHSLGEWSAYVASGALTLEEGVLAVYWRGRYMEEAFPFDPDPESKKPMAAVIGLPEDVVQTICAEVSTGDSVVVPANINDPGQIVISGNRDAVAAASERLQEAGARRVIPLKVAAPFHSPLMDPVRAQLEEKLDELGISIVAPSNRIISNLTAEATDSSSDHLALLMGQITGSVLWNASMAQAWSLGALEMVSLQASGKSVLAGFARKIFSHERPMQIVDPRVPAERHALRFAPGTISTTSYPDSPEVATRKLLLHGSNVPAIARTIKELMATGRPEDAETALLVVQNRYDRARRAGLRGIEPFRKKPGVQETLEAWGLEWPPPEVLDLPRQPIGESTVRYKDARGAKQVGATSEALKVIYGALEESGLAPIDLERLVYFVETRWGGDPKKLQKIINALQRLGALNAQRLGLYNYGPREKGWRGVNSWEKVMLVVDYSKGAEFERPGALNTEGIG